MRRAACSSVRPLGVVMLAVVVATIVRQVLDPYLDPGQVFSWYYMAVVAGAWCGGWRVVS